MKRRGFTLIEVIVAISVFALATLCGTAFVSFGNNILARAREQSYALMVSEQEMAKCKYKCCAYCSGFTGEVAVPSTATWYMSPVGVTYTTNFSWVKVKNPYGLPNAGEQRTIYDWYKIIWVTTTWHSNVDDKDCSLSLHTVGVLSPRHTYNNL